MNLVDKIRQQASNIDLKMLKKFGIERDLAKYYILGNYPPLIVLDSIAPKKIENIFINKEGATRKELDIYIHFPFCEKKCKFCHFYSVCHNQQEVARYLTNLKKEIGKTVAAIGEIKARSVYIGGGTPSMMTARQITELVSFLKSKILVDKDTLFSFDINPNLNRDKHKNDKVNALITSGVNRVVFGGVDLNDDVLRGQGRVHTLNDEIELIDYLKHCNRGLQVAVDMMVGVPGQTLESWNETLDILIAKKIDCVMVFPLMFKSVQANWYEYKKNTRSFPSVKERIELYLLTMERFNRAGYIHAPMHYFNLDEGAFNGQQIRKFESLDETELLAFGASSFGFINGFEYFNIPTIQEYNSRIESGELPTWKALKLNRKMLLERDLMFQLFSRGIQKKTINAKYGTDIDLRYKKIIRKLTTGGLIKSSKTKICLTKIGRLFAEEVCDKFAGEDVRSMAEKRAKRISPHDPLQRYNYNIIGHRLE